MEINIIEKIFHSQFTTPRYPTHSTSQGSRLAQVRDCRCLCFLACRRHWECPGKILLYSLFTWSGIKTYVIWVSWKYRLNFPTSQKEETKQMWRKVCPGPISTRGISLSCSYPSWGARLTNQRFACAGFRFCSFRSPVPLLSYKVITGSYPLSPGKSHWRDLALWPFISSAPVDPAIKSPVPSWGRETWGINLPRRQ